MGWPNRLVIVPSAASVSSPCPLASAKVMASACVAKRPNSPLTWFTVESVVVEPVVVESVVVD